MSESSYGGSSYNGLPRTELLSGSMVLQKEEAAYGACASCHRANAGMQPNSSPVASNKRLINVHILFYSIVLWLIMLPLGRLGLCNYLVSPNRP